MGGFVVEDVLQVLMWVPALQSSNGILTYNSSSTSETCRAVRRREVSSAAEGRTAPSCRRIHEGPTWVLLPIIGIILHFFFLLFGLGYLLFPCISRGVNLPPLVVMHLHAPLGDGSGWPGRFPTMGLGRAASRWAIWVYNILLTLNWFFIVLLRVSIWFNGVSRNLSFT